MVLIIDGGNSASSAHAPGVKLAVFGLIFHSALRGGKSNLFIFFFIGASAINRFASSRIFRYGLPKDILSKGKKQGRGRRPPPPWAKGLRHLSRSREVANSKFI